MRVLLLGLCAGLATFVELSGAQAQPAADASDEVAPSVAPTETGKEASAPATAAPNAAAKPATPTVDETAAGLYDLAFEALALGKQELALGLLRQLESHHPGDPLAARAAELRRILGPSVAPAEAVTGAVADRRPPKVSPARLPQHPESRTGAARAELLFFQTLHGIALGVETCVLLECAGDARPWALSLMAGGGLGFGLSLYLSSDGITPGMARAMTAGTLWGAWHGAMLGIATHAFDNADHTDKAVALALGLGQLSGMALGSALAYGLQPTAGQVSLTSSGGIWVTAVAGMGILMSNAEPTAQTIGLALTIASDVGLVAGGLLARVKPMPASRVLLLDAGGVLGTLAGMGIAVLAGGSNVKRQLVGGLGLVGAAAGLGLSFHLTRDWDEGEAPKGPEVALGLLPAPGGALASARFVM